MGCTMREGMAGDWAEAKGTKSAKTEIIARHTLTARKRLGCIRMGLPARTSLRSTGGTGSFIGSCHRSQVILGVKGNRILLPGSLAVVTNNAVAGLQCGARRVRQSSKTAHIRKQNSRWRYRCAA